MPGPIRPSRKRMGLHGKPRVKKITRKQGIEIGFEYR